MLKYLNSYTLRTPQHRCIRSPSTMDDSVSHLHTASCIPCSHKPAAMFLSPSLQSIQHGCESNYPITCALLLAFHTKINQSVDGSLIQKSTVVTLVIESCTLAATKQYKLPSYAPPSARRLLSIQHHLTIPASVMCSHTTMLCENLPAASAITLSPV
jgi:hypothetical protein